MPFYKFTDSSCRLFDSTQRKRNKQHVGTHEKGICLLLVIMHDQEICREAISSHCGIRRGTPIIDANGNPVAPHHLCPFVCTSHQTSYSQVPRIWCLLLTTYKKSNCVRIPLVAGPFSSWHCCVGGNIPSMIHINICIHKYTSHHQINYTYRILSSRWLVVWRIKDIRAVMERIIACAKVWMPIMQHIHYVVV